MMEMSAELTADVLENILRHGKFNIPTKNAMENAVRILREDACLMKEQEVQKFFVDESGKITPLPVVVRCKNCKHRGHSEKCVLAAISEEKDFPIFMLDNRGEWFCADGERETPERFVK